MKNKSSIMTFSALQILIFHLWVFVMQNNQIEIFIKQISYIGVDIFFFLSAYSLANRPIKSYKSFILNRFYSVYLKFILFSLFAFVYFNWSFSYLVSVLTGINLFMKGGGAFLWFLPAIMLFYVVFPLFQKCDSKNRLVTFISVLSIWLIVSFIISNLKYLSQIGIFWNRVPIFLLGYYTSKFRHKYWIGLSNSTKLIIGFVSTTIGVLVSYKFAFRIKLQYPFTDMFYIVVIPLVLGLVILLSLVPVNKISKVIGSVTLEMYAIQVIFGYDIVNKLIKLIDNKLVINLLSIMSIIIISIVINCSYDFVCRLITDYRRRLNK